jgi:hypothetical protein
MSAQAPRADRWVRDRRAAFQIVNGRALVIVAPQRTTHLLDEVATFVWTLLQKPVTADEITSAVAGEFDVTHAQARQDIEHILAFMEEAAMIRRISSGP